MKNNIHILSTDKPSRLYYHSDLKQLVLTNKIIVRDTDGIINQNIYITNNEKIKEGDWFIQTTYEGIFKCSDAKIEYIYFDGDSYEPIRYCKKIILATDTSLDGVQAIDDKFLEWFVKNPSCECVTVYDGLFEDRIWKKHIIIPKKEPKTAWVGVLHDKLNEYYPAEYELKDIYQGQGCLPNFPDEELCQIWCDSKYKEEPNYNMKQEILDEMEKQETHNSKRGLIEVQLKNPNDCAYYEEIGCLKDICDCYTLVPKQERSYSEEEVIKLIIDFLFTKGIGKEVGSVNEWFEQFKKK